MGERRDMDGRTDEMTTISTGADDDRGLTLIIIKLNQDIRTLINEKSTIW